MDADLNQAATPVCVAAEYPVASGCHLATAQTIPKVDVLLLAMAIHKGREAPG